MQKHVNLVDLVKSFPTNIYLQNLASIQKRTSPVKFAHLAEKSGKGSISNLSTKVTSAGSAAACAPFGRSLLATEASSARPAERRGFVGVPGAVVRQGDFLIFEPKTSKLQDARYVIHTITFFAVSCPENSAFFRKNRQIFENIPRKILHILNILEKILMLHFGKNPKKIG